MKIRYRVLYVEKNKPPTHIEYEVDSVPDLFALVEQDLPDECVVSIVPIHEDFHKYINSK